MAFAFKGQESGNNLDAADLPWCLQTAKCIFYK